jgi:hypothetical protein
MKKIYLFAVIATLILSGCATLWVAGGTTSSDRLVYEDTIVAMGETKKNKNLVLLGEKKTYLLTYGGDRLSVLANLDPEKITIDSGKVITLVLTKEGFSTELNVKYSPEAYSEQENKLLTSKEYYKKAYPDRPGSFYTATVSIRGQVFDKSDKDLAAYNLRQGRKIRIESVTSDASPRPDKFVTMPMAVAFDIVTSPLQLTIFSLYPDFSK